MIIGSVLFAYGVYGNLPVTRVVEERDSKYPAYRRKDVQNWNYPRLYLGAITVLPLRVVFGAIVFFLTFLMALIVSIGVKYPDPLPKWRLSMVHFIEYWNSQGVPFVINCQVTNKTVDIDYTYWLGPDYKKE